MSKAAAQNALDKFNDEGWESIEPFFQSFESFYNFLVKNGLDEELDFKSIPDEYENMYMSVMLNHNPQKTLKYIKETRFHLTLFLQNLLCFEYT